MQKKFVLTISICIIFLACVILSLVLLFSVQRVTVDYTVFSRNDEAGIYSTVFDKDTLEELDGIFSKYKKKSLVFFDTKKVYEDLDGYSYVKVEEVRKEYPNRIIVKISERKEIYALNVDGTYFMIDEEGYLLSKKNQNANNVDGVRNVLLKGFSVNQEAQTGKPLELINDENFALLRVCAKEFVKIRDKVSEFYYMTEKNYGDFVFVLKSGVKLVIASPSEIPEKKIEVGLAHYAKLDDDAKTRGYIFVDTHNDGNVYAVWGEHYEE